MAEAPCEDFKCETMDSCYTECEKVKMSLEWPIGKFLELKQANGEDLHSRMFTSDSDQPAQWKLAIYPRGESKEYEDSVGLYLCLLSSRSAEVRAKFTVESKDIHGKTIVGLKTSELLTFSTASNASGFESYVKRDWLKKTLKKSDTDALVIHCSVIVYLDIWHRSLCDPIYKALSEQQKFKMSYMWTIKGFLELPQVNGEVVESKVFPSADGQLAHWKLKVYPKGDIEEDEASVALYLQLQSSEMTKVYTQVTFLGQNFHGDTVFEQPSKSHTFDNVSKNFGYRVYMNRDTLTNSLEKSASDTLVIHCSIIVFHFYSIITSGPGFSMKFSNNTRLSKDFQSLLLDKSYSDFVINICDRKFNVHKCILHIRSPVFAAMLSSDMESLTLDDVDPDVFEKVLQFMYTSELPMMASDALEIFRLADKYNILFLKLECIDVLRIGICKSTAVKTLILADAHNLDELKKVALKYISWNIEVISKTQDWSRLVASCPKLVTEVYWA